MAPLLQNLVLSAGDNEELAYCLKAWQALPDTVKTGRYPAKDDALKVCVRPDKLGLRLGHSITVCFQLHLCNLPSACSLNWTCCKLPWGINMTVSFELYNCAAIACRHG